MKNKKRMIVFWQMISQYFPLIIIQSVIFLVITNFHNIVYPRFLQTVFSHMEMDLYRKIMYSCLQYAGLLSIALLLAYVNNVILDANCFRAMHHIICNIFVGWHKTRGGKIEDGVVFQNVTLGASSIISLPVVFIQFVGTISVLLYLLFFSATIYPELPYVLGSLFIMTLVLNMCEFKIVKKREHFENNAMGTAEEDARNLLKNMEFLKKHAYLGEEKDKYKKSRTNVWNARVKKQNSHSTIEIIADVVMALSFASVFVLFIKSSNAIVVTMADVAATIVLLQSIAGNVTNLLATVKSTGSLLSPLERVVELIQGQVVCKEINYNEEIILIDTTLPVSIKKGEHIAIIGYNGSGKTTLINKICGGDSFGKNYSVKVFGEDPKTLSYEDRRKIFSIAPKEELLFDETAQENILMNADDTPFREVDKLAGSSGSVSFLHKNALQLSGGQAKRINLIRACIHPAQIIIADEPTSSLDKENAIRAMHMLHSCSRGRNLLIVTHEPEFLSDFDRIIFMKNFEPAFVGCYDDLLKYEEYPKWVEKV